MTDRQAFDTMSELYHMLAISDLNRRESEVVRILIDKGFLVYDNEDDTVRKVLT